MSLGVRVDDHVTFDILLGVAGEGALGALVQVFSVVHYPQVLVDSRLALEGLTTVLAREVLRVSMHSGMYVQVAPSQRLIVATVDLKQTHETCQSTQYSPNGNRKSSKKLV